MQKARRHSITELRPLVSVWFQVLLSPSYSEYFSPFLHSTGSLSVSQKYLALPDGAGKFKRGVSNPALLRIPPLQLRFSYGAITLYGRLSHTVQISSSLIMWSYNPLSALTDKVWALALSLATTGAITIVFSSSRYLDVSVPWVCLPLLEYHCWWVAPFGHLRINSCLRIPAAFRSLPRPSSPLRA